MSFRTSVYNLMLNLLSNAFLRTNGYKVLDMQLQECVDDVNLPVNSFGVPV